MPCLKKGSIGQRTFIARNSLREEQRFYVPISKRDCAVNRLDLGPKTHLAPKTPVCPGGGGVLPLWPNRGVQSGSMRAIAKM